MNQQNSITPGHCVNQTNMTSNYLAMTCTSQLANTSKIISDINTVTSTGWFVVTAWLEKDSNSSSSPTKVMEITSQNGGQSYFPPFQMVPDSNSSKRNLHLGISQENVYATYEQDMGSNKYDVFLVNSTDGGFSFHPPVNKSASPADTKDSILTVDPINGKWIITYLEEGVHNFLVNGCGGC